MDVADAASFDAGMKSAQQFADRSTDRCSAPGSPRAPLHKTPDERLGATSP
jgi:hypothetical protein